MHGVSVSLQSAPLLPALRTWVRRGLKAPTLRFEPAPAPVGRQLLVDVSVIVSGDAGTGIQRVVRALLGHLVLHAGEDFAVQPIFATRDHGYCRAQIEQDGRVVRPSRDRVLHRVCVQPGDIFLGLDLAAHLIPHLERDLERWRQHGVSLNFLVYDLLPVQRPEWFPASTPTNIDRWLRVLARQADRCICISNAVAKDLAHELQARTSGTVPVIATIPLGCDLGASFPSRGLPSNVEDIRAWLRRHKVVLAVGTVEPRKGYDRLLETMTFHWTVSPSSNLGLLIIGRRGWKTHALQERILEHHEHGQRLLWLDEVSDELLAEVYENAAGMVATSYGEGFGLPLIEALAHGLPVLARDLPVFREIGGAFVDYFDDDATETLEAQLQLWLRQDRRPDPRTLATLPRWADSGAALISTLRLMT